MSHLILAEFASAEGMMTAAGAAARAGHRAADALTPFPVPEIMPLLIPRAKRPIGWVMVLAGLAAAGAAWFMQWYSATIDFPLISGNRPANSWPIFFLVTYEVCILFSGIAGFVAFVRDCRLPCLNHPLFESLAVERASQDRFLLVFDVSEEARHSVHDMVATFKPASTAEVAL